MSKEKTPMQQAIDEIELMQSDKSAPNDFEYGKEIAYEKCIELLKSIRDNQERESHSNHALCFNEWLMDNCELSDDNTIWSFQGEDYSNERLHELFMNEKYGTDNATGAR